MPNTPSTRPAPGKGRGGNQRDLDKGWGCDRRGLLGGCHHCREGVGASWSPFLSEGRVEGCSSNHWDVGCNRTMWEEHWGPGGRGTNKKVGAPGDWGNQATEAVAKPSRSFGNLLLLPPCLPWPGVSCDSSVAKPLIGAARPGNPNYRPGRDGCARGSELSCAAYPPPHTYSAAALQATTWRHQSIHSQILLVSGKAPRHLAVGPIKSSGLP